MWSRIPYFRVTLLTLVLVFLSNQGVPFVINYILVYALIFNMCFSLVSRQQSGDKTSVFYIDIVVTVL